MAYYWDDGLYLSTNAILDANAVRIALFVETDLVNPGEVYWQTNQVQVPVFESGVYYLILSVNTYGALFETNTSNNKLTVPVTFIIQPPDLAPIVSLVPRNVVAPPDPAINLTWGVTNQGTGAAMGNWTERVAFSTDPLPPYWVASSWDTDYGPLSPGQTQWHSDSIQLPILQSGTYSIEFLVDYNGDLYESDEANNRTVVPISFEIQPIDLAPIVLNVPTVITSAPDPMVSVTWAVTNQGVGALLKLPAWTDAVYFSPDGLLDGSQTRIWSAITN